MGERKGRGLAGWICTFAVASSTLSACTDATGFTDRPRRPSDGSISDGGDDDDQLEPRSPNETAKGDCTPPVSSDQLPQRELTMLGGSGSEATGGAVFTSDLYNAFLDHCGSCHANGANQGGLDVTQAQFPELVTRDSLQRVLENENEAYGMPRPFMSFDERPDDDPLRAFAAQLEQWLDAGSPADVYYPEMQGHGGGEASPYRLERRVGAGMTNVGNCIPSEDTVATEREKMRQLDEMFEDVEELEDLPKYLRETDLFTLDQQELARHGVIAFAPGYTLWADNAKKVRQIRVPHGTSVKFDEDEQSFDIPSNTRFYKTFLIKVTDLDGNVGYRKMETRIIITRPDEEIENGGAEWKAIFGTYKWNEDETEAVLQTTPYRDGHGFADDVGSYVIDERIEDQVMREAPDNLAQELIERGARRHYAIPGFDRCVHCHMGSPNRDFSLGFIPLQLYRRPVGEGGVIEPSLRDEVNQLERFIDYGLVTGMDSPDDVVPLEESQGRREPRNEHEVKAQGYMLGNCAHCHNPRGFPSRRETVLADALNFMPGRDGGIFEFPLDAFSPRTFLKDGSAVPYITPSLFDRPVLTDGTAGAPKWISRIDPTPAERSVIESLLHPEDSGLRDLLGVDEELAQTVLTGGLQNTAPDPVGRPLLAPWRSLIYRNVDAPFSYSELGAIYPHMPMDTPGYDCRARHLLGTWMASIPAVRAEPPPEDLPEGLRDYYDLFQPDPEEGALYRAPTGEEREQAEAEAAERVARFQESERYRDCPEALDIVAPEVASGARITPAGQETLLNAAGNPVNDAVDVPVEEYWLRNIPARAHYPKTDLRDDQIWVQRRDDWEAVLRTHKVDPEKQKAGGETALRSEYVISTVNEMQVTEADRDFALTPIPFGVWQRKSACEDRFNGSKKVSEIQGEDAPLWATDTPLELEPDAPVYEISRGGAVFNAVCSKCHGERGDGRSALASTIADLTGGRTRVANLTDGLFGPPFNPGANRAPVFELEGIREAEAENWVARYVMWMGLGGTRAAIPQAAVNNIAVQDVLGVERRGVLAIVGRSDAANMLSVVEQACGKFIHGQDLAFDYTNGRLLRFVPETSDLWKDLRALADRGMIVENGDAEVWRDLCQWENPLPLRVVTVSMQSITETPSVKFTGPAILWGNSGGASEPATNLYRRAEYPDRAAVGNHLGELVAGLRADNLAPWCTRLAGSSGATHEDAERMLGTQLPWCPQELLQETNQWTFEEARKWTLRGAANAGTAVFLYLDAVAKGLQPQPPYDRCEELPEL